MNTKTESSLWQPIATAPRDGTSFVWFHYGRAIHADRPHEYTLESEVIRRVWSSGAKKGDGFWMGRYFSIPDNHLDNGWWAPVPMLEGPI